MADTISFLLFVLIISVISFAIGFCVIFIPYYLRHKSERQYGFSDMPTEYKFEIDKKSTPLPDGGIDGSKAVDSFIK